MSKSLSRSAQVALRAPQLPAFPTLAGFHTKHFPTVPAFSAEAESSATGISFGGAESTFSVTLSPSPMPWSELVGPCETAWHWPQATKRLQVHSAHLVVTATSSTLDVIDLTLALTRVVAAAALATPALGIYWDAAMQVHNVKNFVVEAEKATRTQLPLYLWLRFGLVREDDGSNSLYTTGLSELDRMEVELPHSALDPQTMVDRAFNIAHYLLEKGPVLDDGQTIGVSEDERFIIAHAPSILDPERRVYSLRSPKAQQVSVTG